MGANKLVLAAAGVSMLLWVATPVLAGRGHGGGNVFGFGDTEKHSAGHHFGTTGKPHTNKHGNGEPTPPHTSPTMILAATLNSE